MGHFEPMAKLNATFLDGSRPWQVMDRLKDNSINKDRMKWLSEALEIDPDLVRPNHRPSCSTSVVVGCKAAGSTPSNI